MIWFVIKLERLFMFLSDKLWLKKIFAINNFLFYDVEFWNFEIDFRRFFSLTKLSLTIWGDLRPMTVTEKSA